MSQKGYKFNIIYPRGCDTLAKGYAAELEKYRIPLGQSLGFCGGDYQKNPIPVIIHSKNMAANGMVTWAPSRMELYSLPEWTDPSAMPWKTMLSIHEGRHFAQMQFGYRHVFKPFYWIFGQMVPGAVCVYPDKMLLEGDAVVAETALSASGRGRSGDFLLRYMYSFDNGDNRDWTRWRLGSYYRPTPNNYAFGYFVISGIRARYDAPLFMADYFDYVSRRPYDPWPLRHTARRTSGKKFQQTFKEIKEYQYSIWNEHALSEGKFVEGKPLLKKDAGNLRTYSDPIDLGERGSLWKRNDMYRNSALVLIDSLGNEKRLSSMDGVLGKIRYDATDSSLIWNELRNDPRWKQKRISIVKKYHLPSGRKRVIATDDNCIYPVAYNDSCKAAISYYEDGSEWITLISKDKKVSRLYALPDSLQAIQMCVLNGEFYVTAISPGGSGIYKIGDKHSWQEVLSPRPVQIRSLACSNDAITFRSDFSGLYEFYQLDPETGNLQRLTTSRYGGYDFTLTSKGDVLTSRISKWGSEPCVIRSDSLQPQKVNWDEYHHYAVADKLSYQEKILSARNTRSDTSTVFSSPVKYKKAAHAIRIHSWAPLYTDLSAVMSAGMDVVEHPADLGAMAFFQNNHSTLSGWVGYSAAKNKYDQWHHAGHINLTYKGLYPVFEFDAHYGESDAVDYRYNETRDSLFSHNAGYPLLRVGLKTYVPLSWSDNSALYGVIPTLGIKYHNNSVEGKTTLFLNASLRGYVMSRTPSGCIYPSWGIGAEVAYTQPFVHYYLYGYVPGICLGQGLRISAVNQRVVSEGAMFLDTYVNVIPRGFKGLRMYSGSKLTLDYAIPFYMGDWHIGTAFYCKRGIVTPHFDYATNHKGASLGSAGASFELEFGSFLWVRAPITAGVTFSANSWKGFETSLGFDKTYVGLLFNITLPN